MTNRKQKTKQGTPGLQKFLLYLILANFILVWLYHRSIPSLPVFRSLLVTSLLIGYNLLLCKLVVRRARRHGDSYVVYPVVMVSIFLCASVLYVYLIR